MTPSTVLVWLPVPEIKNAHFLHNNTVAFKNGRPEKFASTQMPSGNLKIYITGATANHSFTWRACQPIHLQFTYTFGTTLAPKDTTNTKRQPMRTEEWQWLFNQSHRTRFVRWIWCPAATTTAMPTKNMWRVETKRWNGLGVCMCVASVFEHTF